MNSRVSVALLMILVALIAYIAFGFVISSDDTEKLECADEAGRCYKTIVSKVVDGDTIKTTDDNSIRFALSSAPELDEEGGIEAKQFIEDICPVGSSVIIDEDDKQLGGSYGRIVALVTCNGMYLNGALIMNDHGTIDTRFCNSEFSSESWASTCN